MTSEKSTGWLASFNSIFSFLPFQRGRGTSITRLFRNVPGYPRILLIGLPAAGKTLLLKNFLSSSSKAEDITISFAYSGYCIEMLQSQNATFHTYDIGGCFKGGYLGFFDRVVFREAEAAVFLVDANDQEAALQAREELMNHGLLVPDGMRKETPLLILANKQDLPHARTAEEMKAFFRESLSTAIGDRPWEVFPTTVRTGEGIAEAFAWLASILFETTARENTRKSERQDLLRQPTPNEEVRKIYEKVEEYKTQME